MLRRSRYSDVVAYLTKDGSTIRELMHPAVHGNAMQSLAEAMIAPGDRTQRHRHRTSEEIYFVIAGEGVMSCGDEQFPIAVGDTIGIAPGTPHAIENTGAEPLRILCACTPAYSHDDTEIVENNPKMPKQ